MEWFEAWKEVYVTAVVQTFGSRIVCAGVQGSRARGEARESSDIDTVLILDTLTSADLDDYRILMHSLPNADLACGFVSGREELLHWDEGELVGFYFDTVCLIGNLDFLRPHLTREAAKRSAQQAACGLYHALCHAAVFESQPLDARAFAKGLFFLLRARCYAKTGLFPLRLSELLSQVGEAERLLLSSLEANGCLATVFDRAAALDLLSGWIRESTPN